MAAYPTMSWMRDGTQVARDGGLDPVRATNGALKVRRLFSADKADFKLTHWLSDAQKSTLDSFYGTNRVLDVTLTAVDDGASYTVRFAEAPQYEKRDGYWVSQVHLVEV